MKGKVVPIAAVGLFLAVVSSLHVRLTHGGVAALRKRLAPAAAKGGELVVGHLPVT